ncbi:membrane protein, partial [Escherichia coli]
MDTGLSEVLVFKLFRTEAATPTVPPPPIVITFDIIKHRCPHYFPADKVFS